MDRFRKNYTPLTDGQKALGLAIKEKAEDLLALIHSARRKKTGPYGKSSEPNPEYWRKRLINSDANRCLSTAHDRLEESVMWAVKGVYTEIPVFVDEDEDDKDGEE